MAVLKSEQQKKLVVVVNEGSTASPSLKNRPIGTGYWINPNSTVATNEKLYQLGEYFGALQAHTVSKITTEFKYNVTEE